MELLQLKYFCDAAKSENFSKTAKKYLVPTSNISQSVKRLESELGCTLFEHKANRVKLNSEGRELFLAASAALDLLEGVKGRLSDNENELRGEIRLVCLNNRRTVTGAIEKFVAKHPQVNFIIQHGIRDADPDFDICVSDSCPYNYGKKIPLLNEEIHIAMSKSHPLAFKNGITLSDMKNERFITMTKDSSLYKITVKACTDAGFTPNISIQTDDPLYLRKYIEMGLGIAFVPSKSWMGMFDENVVIVPIEGVSRKTYVYLPKAGYVKRSIEEFIEVLNEEVQVSIGFNK